MSLGEEERASMVIYRIEKALATLEDAEFAVQMERWNMAANRLYYALYHAASALLLSQGITSHTHKGLITQLSLTYVKTGLLTIEEGKLIRRLFNMRNEDDYSDFIEADQSDITPLLPQVRLLLNKLIKLNKLYQPPKENPEQ